MVNSFLIKEVKQVNEGKVNHYNKQYENNGYLYVPQMLSLSGQINFLSSNFINTHFLPLSNFIVLVLVKGYRLLISEKGEGV